MGALEPTLLRLLSQRNIGLQTNQYPQCGYLSAKYITHKIRGHPCVDINREREGYYKSLERGRTFVVFHAPQTFNQLSSDEARFNSSNQRWIDHLQQLQYLLDLGHRIVFVYGVPRPRVNSRLHLSQMITDKYVGGDVFGIETKKDVDIRYRFVKEQLNKFLPNEAFVVLNVSDVLCELDGKRRCYDYKKGVGPIFNNGSHLSYLGAELVANMIITRLGIQ